MSLTKIAEGKTKIIWQNPTDRNCVMIESKDTITAGDGTRRHVLPGKGALANRTTCNCFVFLSRRGVVPTHFIGRVSDTVFEARNIEMIPIELVARRHAAGSYLKRNPTVEEGTEFADPVVEHFLKDDLRHDPLITYDFERQMKVLHDPQQPIGSAVVGEEPMLDLRRLRSDIDILNDHLRQVFRALELAWALSKVVLVDLKIECGRDRVSGRIVVADVIDNDSWRIWPGGRKEKMLDKQVYRDLPNVTDEKLADILANYATVANETDKFC